MLLVCYALFFAANSIFAMRRLLFPLLILLMNAVATNAQTPYFQGFDASATNNWTFTATPGAYLFGPTLNDMWKDTTYMGNTTSGNVAIAAAAQGTRFWGMWDLENPYSQGLIPAPYWHYLTFDPVALTATNTYAVKFNYFTHIVGGTGDSIGYIVEYNNGTTWNMSSYVNLPVANKIWDSVAVAVPSGSTYVRLRICARINGGDDWAGVDAVKVDATPIPPSLTLAKNFIVTDEAVDTLKVAVIIANKNATNTTVNVGITPGFNTTNSSDVTLLTPTLTFNSSMSDTQYVRLKVNNDTAPEAAEYLGLQFSGVVNATMSVANQKATVYIKDNDYTAPVARKNIEMMYQGSYTVPYAGSSAEIIAYDSASNRLFSVNSLLNILHILDFSNPSAITEVDTIHLDQYGGGINSIAVKKGIVAMAIEANPSTDDGKVVFLDTNGNFLKEVPAGAMPDMITFTPDGNYVLTANEGEPMSDYSIDPEGSVTIVDISTGVTNATAVNATFTAYNGQETLLRSQGIRIYGPGSSAAQDFEPEYITVSPNSDKAWVTLQENNAIATIDIVNKTITDVKSLGYTNHLVSGNALDASDNNGEVLIANWPVRGLHLPDAMSSFTVNGNTFLVTANEGDARDYDAIAEESRIGSGSYKLDPVAFPQADLLKANHNLGRLNAVNTLGDVDGDGDFDEIYVMGSRSFSIFNSSNINLIYDSGNDFEQITYADPVYGGMFNADNAGNAAKNRSDNKGPEPEGVTVGSINDTTYAFITLERMGGVMVYDVSNPLAPVFVQYINTRTTAAYGGDQGPEGIIFLAADKNPHNKNFLLTANEVSGTVAVFEIKSAQLPNSVAAIELPRIHVYPNPAKDKLFFSQPVSGTIFDISGKTMARFTNANNIDVSAFAKGIYMLKADGFKVERVVIQ
ncbi:MAG: T9SS type A sorting domain-containing protein [Sphingobacteriales bacterium]|nr:MAG: T9SS type A sorting domain-containing protein [Sphingobacteriales bacterium]